MNKVYKIVWNESLGTWCAISEVSKTRGKRSSVKTTVAGALVVVSALTMSSMAAAADHYVSINDGGTQGGNYNNDGATGLNAIAVGVGAKAAGENAIAIGNVSADAINSIAIGNNNSLSNTASSSTAIGHNNNVTGNEAIALGANNTVKDFSGVAVGSYNNAEGYRSIAVGAENKTKGQWSSAFGVWNTAEGERAIALGANNTIQGTRALGVGVANEISSTSAYSSAVGAFNKITDNTKSLTAGFLNTITGGEKNSVLGNENTLNNAKNTTVLGNKNTVAQENTQVLGNNVTTTQANSVVLGNESTDRAASVVDKVTINGEDYAFAGVGAAANGVVSVGKVGGERQIINVAAGEISATSTDAINGSQLYATNKAIADSQTHYVSINDGGTQGGNYNNDGATGLNALAVGLGASATGERAIAIGLNAGTNNDGGGNISVGSNSGQHTKGQGNTALGSLAGRDVTGSNNTGLGVNASVSITGHSNLAVGDSAGGKIRGNGNNILGLLSGLDTRGDFNNAVGAYAGQNVVGNKNMAEGYSAGRNVQGDSNLALGDSAGENVTGNRNVALGRAAGQGLNNVDDATSLGSGAKAAVRNSVALGANSEAIRDVNSEVAYVPLGTTIVAAKAAGGEVSVGAVGKERRISNVAAASQDTDAVNLSQLKAVQAATTTHYLSINDGGTQGGNYNNDGAVASGSVAIGVDSSSFGTSGVAIGHNADVSGLQGIAIGNNAQAGYQSIALGFDTVATAFNSMALGNRAIAYTDGTTLGQGTYANKLATAMGNGALAVGQESSAYGYSALAGTDSFNQPSAGTDPDTIGKAYATAMGSRAKASAQGSTAVGAGSVAEVDNGIALGANSVANTGAGVAGYVPISANQPQKDAINATQSTLGAVSVGSVGNTRQITNVAAGTIDSDAVNVAQLKAVQAATTTHYFSVNDEGIQGNNYNNDGATGKNALAAGRALAGGESSVAIGEGTSAKADFSTAVGFLNTVTGQTSVAVGGGNIVAGKNSTAVGASNNVTQENTQVLGNNVTTTQANSVVLGNESTDHAASVVDKVTINGEDYAFAGVGSAANGVVSVGKVGGERQIINVAAGEISATSTDAVNGSQLYATNQAVEKLYAGAGDTTHYVSINDGGIQGNNYNNDGATGLNAVAVGVGASASGDNAVAVGSNNISNGNNTATLGSNNKATSGNYTNSYSVALGVLNESDNGTAIGYANNAGRGNVAVGAHNISTGVDTIALGYSNHSLGNQSLSVGMYNTVSDGQSFATGFGNNIQSNKIGFTNSYNVVSGMYNSIAEGSRNSILGSGNTSTNTENIGVVGSNNTLKDTKNTFVLGSNVTITQANSVVLGNASTDRAATAVDKVSINGEDYVFAGVGSTANGVVSVGKVGGERQIINVAAGEISANSTDAVNGSQLHATNQAVEKLYAGAGDTTHYVSVNDTGTKAGNYNNDGASGALAVAVGVGASAKGDGATALGLNSSAKSKDAVAIGTDTRAELEGSVALGKGSVANTAAGIAGFDPLTGFGSTNTGSTWRSSAAAFSVGDVSRGITRQITGVAAGTADTDAVNVAQLKAAISKSNEAKGSTETVSAGKNTEVTKTTQADGSTDYQVATKDDVSFDSVTVGNIKADSQSNTISGLADGKVSADSDQAVNGSQLHDTTESVANALGGNAKVNPDGTIKTSNIGNTGKDNVHDAIASIHGQVAGAKTSVSAGKNTVVNSSTNTDGSNNYQVALAEDIQLNSVTANQVTAKQVTANKVNVGKVTIDGTTNKVSGLANGEITSTSTDAINGSQLHQTNSSVAQHLGGGSTLNKDGSIGAPTYNVAGGTFHNVGDALGAIDTRVSNLEQAFYDTNKNMDDLRNDTYAGIAGAMAVGNLPQPTEAGMSMVSAGVSGYRGETAVAIGVSAITDSNKIVWKMGASADSRSNIGGAVSMGYQWK
ncbi:YadA-like family protein [Acinetobacter guillouiae]|uniref:YadA-like family protein n=1 Tax=Acinetobacter guillouiae TaxID=106649 RepID=UPI003AF99C98